MFFYETRCILKVHLNLKLILLCSYLKQTVKVNSYDNVVT